MKVCVVGFEGFTFGKKNVPDERVDKLKEVLHLPTVTYIKLEFVQPEELRAADSIVVEQSKKLDLILEDLEIVENRIAQEEGSKIKDLLSRIKTHLENENLISEFSLTEEEKAAALSYNFITVKPVMAVTKEEAANIAELTKRVYQKSGFISFFTSNQKELRAWQIKSGTTAFEAAAAIHSDIQRGFIKAEVIKSEDIIKSGNLGGAKANNLMKLEDKEYVVKDGDWINFRFNV